MLFEIAENVCDIESEERDAELLMQQYYDAQGYCVLNNKFAVVYDPSTTKHLESQETVSRLLDTGL